MQSKKTTKKKTTIRRAPDQGKKKYPPKVPKISQDLTAVSPMAALQVAVNAGIDVDKLGKMLELEEKWEKRQAKKAYVRAMTEFKKNPPQIIKDMHAEYTTKKGNTVKYDHPSLGNVANAINEGLSLHGLFASWRQDQPDGQVKVTCVITHELGHSESSSLQAMPDDSGGKNAIQAVSSSNTYLERYTILALTGLASHEKDKDGLSDISDKEIIKRSKAIRAKYNKLLQDEITINGFEAVCASYKKFHGNFEALTFHNKTEKFWDLFNEHKQRIERIESAGAAEGAKEKWKKDVESCQDEDTFYALEETFCAHPDWEDAETKDLINAKGIELKIDNYIN